MGQAVGSSSPRSVWLKAWAGLITLAALGALMIYHPAHGQSGSGPFVSAAGSEFLVDESPFRFVGVNLYFAANEPDVYQCGFRATSPDRELDDWFGRIRDEAGGSVVRFWAFQGYTRGGTDWRGFDRVVRLATQRRLRLLPVLENQWPDCTRGGYKYAPWYAGGYRAPYDGYPLSYREYVQRVVERYRDEPSILGWTLMNEAESKTTDGLPAPEMLYAFAADMSGLVKSIDRNHLVTLGVIGGAQPGVGGTSFERLHALPTIDFAEYHDYGANDDPLPLPGLRTAIYSQDATWTWRDDGFLPHARDTWVTLTETLPAATLPFQRIGLNLYPEFDGVALLDDVETGGRRYDFEDGTLSGWQASTGLRLSNVELGAAGAGRTLRIDFAQTGKAEQLWAPASADDLPGTTVSLRLLVPGAPSDTPHNSLAAALSKARQLQKPLLIAEVGMTTCAAQGRSQVETPASRAEKFDAKLGAFFDLGGSGYLLWAWHPGADCSFNFSTGDPLNEVLKRYAGQLGR